jgi:hypothetical protein
VVAPAPLKLSHRICLTGQAIVDLDGELDIASAEAAATSRMSSIATAGRSLWT